MNTILLQRSFITASTIGLRRTCIRSFGSTTKLAKKDDFPSILYHPTQHIWLRTSTTTTKEAKITTTTEKEEEEKGSNDDDSNNNNNLSSKVIRIPNFVVVDIGLTERGLDDIGDITSIKIVNNNTTTSINKKKQKKEHNNNTNTDTDTNKICCDDNNILLSIHWEGHTISNADELYHTIWSTYQDQTIIKLPINGKTTTTTTMMMPYYYYYYNSCGERQQHQQQQDTTTDDETNNGEVIVIDEDTVLITIETTLEEINQLYQKRILINEKDYFNLLQKIPPGKFAY